MFNIIKSAKSLLIVATLVLVGCAGSPEKTHPDFAPIVSRPVLQMPEATTGSIYRRGREIAMFEDRRARNIGDIVTVLLVEQTSGSKTTGTNIDKSTSTSVIDPVVGGRDGSTVGSGRANLGASLNSSHEFNGGSGSTQSNKLQGSIAVIISDVLPSGNLVIQGEKWITINQGNEFIRLRGIIRPLDISAENTLLSTQIADARISYGGTGAPAQANAIGWMSQFFLSPLWPF